MTRAKVTVDGRVTGEIENGMLILLGVTKTDDEQHAEALAQKIACLRIFDDGDGKLNKSLTDTDGGVLAVSNFTLYADCTKGRRPDFSLAANYETAERLYDYFCVCIRRAGIKNMQTGVFGGDMKVELLNDGPVTVILNSEDLI